MTDMNNLLEKIIAISNKDKDILRKVNYVKKDNHSYDSLKELADFLLIKRYYEYANKIYDFLLKLSTSSNLLYNKGLALFNLGQYQDSIFYFDRVIELNEDNLADAYTSKATALDYLNRQDEAEQYYALAGEKYSEKINTLNEKANSFLKSGSFKESIDLFDNVLRLEPNNAYALYNKGLALFNLKQYGYCITIINKFLELDPYNVEALFYRGLSFLYIKNYNESIKSFKKITELNEDDANAWYYMGNSLLYSGSINKAEDAYNTALKLYEKYNDKEKKILPLEQLRTIKSNYNTYFNFKESVSISRKLIELDKNNIKFKLMLAEDYIKFTNISEAENQLKGINYVPNEDIRYKKIYEFLLLCSKFLDADEFNDHIGMTKFYNFFNSSEYDNSVIDSNFWNFEGIKYIIEQSQRPNKKKKILLEIITYFQTNKNKETLLIYITSYLSKATIELGNKNKNLIRLFVSTLLGITIITAVISIYYTTINFNEYPTIVVPIGVKDWIIDSNKEVLYYVTEDGKFGEYNIGPFREKFVWVKLNEFFGMNPLINEINITGNPLKIVHDKNKDFIYVIHKSPNIISVIKNAELLNPISVKGSISDVEFDDKLTYVITKKPNTLLIFQPSTSNIENEPLGTIFLKHEPQFLIHDNSNNTIFLINSDSSILSFIDLSFLNSNSDLSNTNLQQIGFKNIKDINLGESNFIPVDAAFNEATKEIIVHNKINEDLIIINASDKEKLKYNSESLMQKIPLKNSSIVSIDIGNNNNTIVSVPITNTIEVIETRKDGKKDIFKTEPLNTSIDKVIFDEKRNMAFVSLPDNSTIIPYDINKYKKESEHIVVGNNPFAMSFDNENSILYVTNTLDNSISIIDTVKNSHSSKDVGLWPNDIAFDNDENKVFVVNSHLNEQYYFEEPSSITILDKITNKSSNHITGGWGSTSIGLNSNNKKIYISNSFNNTVSVLDYNGKIIGNISVGKYPVDIAVNPSDGLVYVANYDDSTISIINSTTDRKIQEIGVGNGPNDIVVENTPNSKIFIVNTISETVSIVEIDHKSSNNYLHKVTNTILVGKNPISAAYYPKKTTLYVANSDNTISVIDSTMSDILPRGTIHTQSFKNTNPFLSPPGIAVNANDGIIYVSSNEYDMVSKYNGTQFEPYDVSYMVKSIPTNKNPYGVKIDQADGTVYANLNSSSIDIFTANKSLTTIINESDISNIDIDQEKGDIYITHKNSDNVTVYLYNNMWNIPSEIIVGYSPSAIFVDEYNSRILVAGNNTLKVYNLNTLYLEKDIPVGFSANSISVDESNNYIYLTDPVENKYLIIDGFTFEIIWSDWSGGNSPSSIAVNQETGDVYISNRNSDSISKITYSERIEIPVGQSPTNIVIDNEENRLYVLNEKSHTVSIIDIITNKIVKSIKVGNYPTSMDVDLFTNDIYVASSSTNNIFVFHDDTIEKISSYFNENNNILSYINSTELVIMNKITLDNHSLILPFKGKDILSDPHNIYVTSNEGYIMKINLNDYNVTSMDINSYPTSMAINQNRNILYILDEIKNKIIAIDTDKFEISKSEIALSRGIIPSPVSIAVDPEVNKIYVADRESNSISIINGNTNKIIDNIQVNGSPVSIAVDPEENKIYGTYANNKKSIYVIQNSTAKTIDIPYTFFPKQIAFTNLGTLIFDYYLQSILLLDKNDSIKSLSYIPYKPNFINPETISIDSKSNKIYALNSKYNTEVNISEILYSEYLEINGSPVSIAVDPEVNKIYVADRAYNNNSISIINGNTNKIIDNIQVNGSPDSIAVDPKTHKAYILYSEFSDYSYGNNYVAIINGNTNKIIDNIQVNGSPVSIAVDPKTHKAYILYSEFSDYSYGNNYVAIINGNTNKIIDNIQVNGSPDSIAVDPEVNKIYVADRESNSISIINGNTNKIIDNIQVNGSPVSIAVDPEVNKIYVADRESNSISIINGNTNKVEKQFQVGYLPNLITLNPITHKLYVGNEGSNIYLIPPSISIINTLKLIN